MCELNLLQLGVIPAIEKLDKWHKGFFGPAAFLTHGPILMAFYVGALKGGLWLKRVLVDSGVAERPPFLDPTRAPQFGPFLPRQCRAVDFEGFSKQPPRTRG